MKKTIAILSVVSLVAAAYSCKKHNDKPGGTVYLDLPATPYVYTVLSNDSTVNQKATLGRVLFYDTHLSLNNAVSCGSCHKQALGFADNVAFSVGYEGRLTKRNSKNIANLNGDMTKFTTLSMSDLPLFWDGRETSVQNLVARPITNHVEMGVDFSALPGKLSALPYYGELFRNAYGDNVITTDRISETIALFLNSIDCKNSRFEQFTQVTNGNPNNNGSNVFTGLEMAGYNLFISKYHCENCHHIFQNSYSTEDFKDIGLDASYNDMGRGTITGRSVDNGKFKVPNLHNVGLSAPYMHDGRYKTLSEVIDHYSHGIENSPNLDVQLKGSDGRPRPMDISDNDKQALIAFLNTLTDYQLITDPKFSNPFKVK